MCVQEEEGFERIGQYLAAEIPYNITISVVQNHPSIVGGFLHMQKHLKIHHIRCVSRVQQGLGAVLNVVFTRGVVVELNEDVVEKFGCDGFPKIVNWDLTPRGGNQVKVTAFGAKEKVEFFDKVIPVILCGSDVELYAVQLHPSDWTKSATEKAGVEVVGEALCILGGVEGVLVKRDGSSDEEEHFDAFGLGINGETQL
ncbi:unnamed protein product [Sphenostylis stenocarpa]|uniref:Uncharacterized protein n=1 Tax=Sphenostylis stenocarpa TaxID=92480 RepID=A0AA86W4G0_9FABA|nr:unnamed protein product [Sphenostylis stenocarpa]